MSNSGHNSRSARRRRTQVVAQGTGGAQKAPGLQTWWKARHAHLAEGAWPVYIGFDAWHWTLHMGVGETLSDVFSPG